MSKQNVRIPDPLWSQLTSRERRSIVFRLRLKDGRTVDRVIVGRDAAIQAREVDARAEYTLEGLEFGDEDIIAIEVPEQEGGQRRRWVGLGPGQC